MGGGSEASEKENHKDTHVLGRVGGGRVNLGSATRHPTTPSKPRLCAAMAAQAMVFTLLGAKGQRSFTHPSE